MFICVSGHETNVADHETNAAENGEDPDWYKEAVDNLGGLNDEPGELFPDEDEVEELDPKKMIVGTTFPDKPAFQRHLKRYCVHNDTVYKAFKSDKDRLRVWCNNRFDMDGNEQCLWMVFASKLPREETFKVKRTILKHTCKGRPKNCRNRSADPLFVAEVVRENLKTSAYTVIPRPCQIADDFYVSHLIDIPYQTAWKARNKVLELENGNYEESYKLVPQFCKMIKASNEGSVARFSYCHIDMAFETMIISFDGVIKAWIAGCRSCIGLDACHTNGPHTGVIMAATALDGQNGLVPLAIMVCRNETIENWTKFLEYLKDKLSGHPMPLTFISDRQKGLLEAVPEVFPGRPHRYCWR